MKIDLHVHTQERSPCAHDSEETQIQAAIDAGLDALFITDHWRLIPPARLEALNQKFTPFCIFPGIELSIDGEDLLVLGIQDLLLETHRWKYKELHKFVSQRGGFLVLAHPFRYHPEINLPLDAYPPDAIEVFSLNTPPAAEAEIRALAELHGLALLSNSDAHVRQHIGRNYNHLQNQVQRTSCVRCTMEPIFNQLRAGNYVLCH